MFPKYPHFYTREATGSCWQWSFSQGNGFWGALLLHKRCCYLKSRVTYTKASCTLKSLPLQLWQDFHAFTPACTIRMQQPSGERKSMHWEAPLLSTQPAWDRGGRGILPCTAASWYSQEFPLLFVRSCKEQKKYITLCWKGSLENCCYFEWHRPQKDSGNLEAREDLLSTHCWRSQCSPPSPITTRPPQIIYFPKHLAISRPCLDLCKCLWHCYVTPPWCCPSACLISDSWENMAVYESF